MLDPADRIELWRRSAIDGWSFALRSTTVWLAWKHGKHQDEPANVLLGVFSTQETADEAGADWSEEQPVQEK